MSRKQRGTKEHLDENERRERKSRLKTQHSSGSITSWQINGETMETVINFVFLGFKITADGDCNLEISLLLERKAMTNLDSIFKRHYFADKGLCSQSYGFSSSHISMWNLDHKEGWMLKNWWFQTMVLEKALESVPWTARRSNQSILKEISSEYSLERLMLKLQNFGHLMWRATYWKRPWHGERLSAGGEGGDRGWDGCMASPTQ